MPMMQSSTELKCFKGLVYFYVVLLSVSRELRGESSNYIQSFIKKKVGKQFHFQGDQVHDNVEKC